MKNQILLWTLVGAAFSAFGAGVASHFNGGRTVPVHKLAPVDAQGDKVSVLDRMPRPFSQAKTCGQCHDVAAMAGGSHFHTGLDTNDAPVLMNKEPWFLFDEKKGTVEALSLCGLPGTKSPADIGMTAWEFTKTFGRAFPGGGVASDPRALAEEGGDKSRWFVTGPLEVNCLACHQQGTYDSSEWARQVLRENFAFAGVAASGFGDVGGMNERLDAAWDATRPENLDDHLFRVPANVSYDRNAFDAKGRCTFRVGKPENARCLACHAASEAGCASHDIAGDVHLQRGMKCVDCHRNGMDHRMKKVSCRECHVEKGGAGPMPVHAGFPLVHFEKLSCKTCHSGVTKDGAVHQVRTARANRIGIYGRAQWATDYPYIIEPVFVKDDKGKIKPCRMTWLAPDREPVYWSFAHDVKPARQARGAAPEKCAACHTADSAFFFGTITPVYPPAFKDAKAEPVSQAKFLRADRPYHMFFGGVFAMRPVFKVFLWVVFGLLCLFAAAAAAVGLHKLSARLVQETENFSGQLFIWIVDAGLVACTLYLAVSGVVGYLTGGMTWWWIVLHMVAGGGFAGCVAILAFVRQAPRTECPWMGALWALWVVLAAGTVFTAVMPMMTVFGMHGQEILLWSHRCTALCFAAVSALICRGVCRRK